MNEEVLKKVIERLKFESSYYVSKWAFDYAYGHIEADELDERIKTLVGSEYEREMSELKKKLGMDQEEPLFIGA